MSYLERRGFRALAAAGAAITLVATSPTFALTDEEIFRDFRFNLLNPGARARGIGGAFLSLADDATAAQSNPAGLDFLPRSEFFVELRASDNAAQSSLVEEPLPGLTTFVATGTDLDDQLGVSFISGVFKFEHWSLGVSRQELINISNSTLSSLAFTFDDDPGSFLVTGAGTIDVDAVNWNASFGFRITDRFRAGATLTYSTLEVQSSVTSEVVDTDGVFTGGVPVLEPTLDLTTSIDDQDDDVVFSLGLLYRVQGRWSIGAVYRRGPRFSVAKEITSIDEGLDVFGVAERLGPRFVDRFSLPDTLAVGGNVFLSPRVMLAADIERILYSNLLDGFVAGVNVLTTEDAQFVVDDATDFRAGVEWVLPGRARSQSRFFLRGGLYTEEPSTVRARSTGSGSLASEEVFNDSGRQGHATVGFGVGLNKYQVDFAADFSEIDNEYLLSFIYRGGK